MELEGQLGCAPRNSVQHHGLPYYPPYYQQHLQCMPPTAMSQHHQYPGPPPGQPIYGAPPNHEQATGPILRPQRKRTRATQVCLVRISLTYLTLLMCFRLAKNAEYGNRNVTKAPRARSVTRTAYRVTIATRRLPSTVMFHLHLHSIPF